MIEAFNDSLLDEVHFFNIALIIDYSFPWDMNLAKQIYDQLIGETSLTFIKNMLKLVFEF